MGLFCDVNKKLDEWQNNLKGHPLENEVRDKLKSISKPLHEQSKKLTNNAKKMLSLKQKSEENKLKTKAKDEANHSAQETDSAVSDNHEQQDAEKDIKHTTVKQVEVKYTNITDMSDINYSSEQDYPNTKMTINKQNDFEKFNFTTGEWWRVHHTGYYQKVDGKGNSEYKVPGTEIYYVMQDRNFMVSGNSDNIFLKNKYNHILEELLEVVDKLVKKEYNDDFILQVLKNMNVDIKGNRSTKIGLNDTLEVNGDLNIKVAGNINLTAGANVNIKGATINLN